VYVTPSGEVSEAQRADALGAWFVPRPFLLCLNCAEAYTLRDKQDFRKLARLSSEGRSTATTLLTLSAVSGMRHSEVEREAQKVLSFTDNRQDASLQAGHFKDFVQVALLRSALCSAMSAHGELRSTDIAVHVCHAMDLTLAEYCRLSNLDPSSAQARNARKAFEDVLEYRIYEDLRRGWRVGQPNLEQSGLLRTDY